MSQISELPLVLAGPILRRTTSESVTVWIALQQACTVELSIHRTTHQGAQIDECLFQGERSTIAIGDSLHIVAVTARSQLSNDQIYAYDLHFTTAHRQYNLEQALNCDRFEPVTISYFTHQKPTFVLPPDRIEDLKFAHGSCRKPHGFGIDALPILDHVLETTAQSLIDRPHQLFLTGDQIYGDDVADDFLEVASPLGDALLGWQEKLPIGQRDHLTYCIASELQPGQRAEIATQQAGFTAGFQKKRDKVSSHLLSLAEYCATYLLVWSPVGWSSEGIANKNIQQFVHTLWKVRRVLANIPTYMIFDDHDVSDDWNLNRAWCLRVYGRPLGRRVVQNALLSYAVFQAWGNTPEQFEPGEKGAELLEAAQNWSKSRGCDRHSEQAIAQFIGMPLTDESTGLPRFVQDGSVMILDRHPDTLDWHYQIQSSCHSITVLDTRTWRGYSIDESAIAPPKLLCPTALKQHLALLKTCQPDQLPFLIAPTNLFGLKIIDRIHEWQLRRKKVFSTDVGDAWNVNTDALAQLLVGIFQEHSSIVVLSGDIHYSGTTRLTFQTPNQPPSILVQLTCSAMKNEELITRILHTRWKHWLLPERSRYWIGWNQPAHMIERHRSTESPDWVCKLEWLFRQPAQRSSANLDNEWLKLRDRRMPLRFWRWKWLQDGREIVGLNNLAVVSFEARSLVHTVYWFSRWKPLHIVRSRYECEFPPID